MADHWVDQVCGALKAQLLGATAADDNVSIDDDYLAEEISLPRIDIVAQSWEVEQRRAGSFPALVDANLTVFIHCLAQADARTARAAARDLAREVESTWWASLAEAKLGGLARFPGTRIVGAEMLGDASDTNQAYADCRLQVQIRVVINEGRPDVIVVPTA